MFFEASSSHLDICKIRTVPGSTKKRIKYNFLTAVQEIKFWSGAILMGGYFRGFTVITFLSLKILTGSLNLIAILCVTISARSVELEQSCSRISTNQNSHMFCT